MTKFEVLWITVVDMNVLNLPVLYFFSAVQHIENILKKVKFLDQAILKTKNISPRKTLLSPLSIDYYQIRHYQDLS